MLEFFGSIIQIITSFATFLFNTISSLVSLIVEIPKQVAFLTSALSALPPFVLPFATAFISINVILFILGRKSGTT